MPHSAIDLAAAKALAAALSGFADRLKARAALSPMSDADVAWALEHHLRDPAFIAAAQRCVRDIAAARMETVREDAFGRLLVRPFAEVLGARFPRARLKSFFEAVRTIVGTDAMVAAEADCAAAAGRLQAERGAKFAWDDLYLDAEAQTVVDRIRFLVARAFADDYGKRLAWFVTLLNHDIRNVSMDSHSFVSVRQEEAAPHVSASTAEALLHLLFADMRPQGMGEARTTALRAAFGDGATETLERLHRAMAAAAAYPS